ncbi:unnamed protein product [Adineta steineri]|uniref:AAA+ ATPase domain-containing protein n=1 Tax=Adineta steineri TaxID=433720 RepID=A0A815FHU2_9BILA|nr:unnamed protein product [Adineta steineri]CAF1587623.1 unnamed protein product [Adineta steineri]
MDERHWWIAAKVEQTFCIDKTSTADASFTETFFRRPDVLEKINSFLCAKGSNKLFFYTTRDHLYSKEIMCCNNIVDEYILVNEPLDNLIILFFVRSDTSSDATVSPVSDIYSGEIKHPAQMTTLLYGQTLLPLFKKELTPSSNDSYNQIATKTTIVTQMEKQIDGINATCNSLQKDKNLLLKRADAEMLNQLKQTGRSTADSPVIRNCETLVLSWITTIENVLQDIFGEDSTHPSLGPLSEIDRWARKQRLINNLLEQLKSKECKAVIGALITSKSKVIRKWKAIDVSITEAQNECRDKTKFLESIRRYLENLTEDSHPQNCAVNILPALCDAMRTVESVSRYYARQGYLGLIFSKVTNQLVKICKHHINDDLSQLWPKLFNEIQSGGSVDDTKENFHLDKRDIKRFREVPKGSVPIESNTNDESVYQRLKNCLLLQASYKEIFRALRDALGGAQMLTTTAFSSASSTISGTTNTHTRDQSQSRHQIRRSSGILMAEDEKIFENLEDFSRRIEQMLDMTITLNQFSQLIVSTVRLPKPKRKDLIDAESLVNRSDVSKHEEEEREDDNEDNNTDNISDEGIDDPNSDSGTPTYDYLHSSVSKTDLDLLKKYYYDDDESLPLSVFIAQGVEQLKSLLIDNNNSPTNDEEKTKFDSIHKNFTSITHEIEQIIGAYLNVTFSKTKRTQEGLTILASFEPVCERNYLRPILRDAYVNLFLNFENDLMDIRTTFEAQKDDPPLLRNAPPIAGAIAWSRTLLTKIEKAMDIFKLNRHIVALGNFAVVSKLYNRTAKMLLVYEQLLLARWKEKIDAWKDHLNASLLRLNKNNDHNRQIEINSNIELFSIFDEVKWFKRLDVDIPKAALIYMQKEQSFKQYKSLLEDLLSRFYNLQSQIYPPFYPLFTSQLAQIYRAFEPGLHTINWSNLNIDVYMTKVHRALDRFETFISNINTLIAEKIDKILDNELMNSSYLLFSIDYIHSKLWTPAEFFEKMSLHINEQAILIGKKLSEVQRRFQEVEDMVRLNSSGQKTPSSSSSTRRAKTPTITQEAMMTFIRYYQDKMNHCIQIIIERTLRAFIQLASVSNDIYLFDQTKLIRLLFEVPNINEQSNNIDTQRIRIASTMQYAIPEITINPEVIICQKSVCDVAYAILNCEKQISASAGFDKETAHRLSSVIKSDTNLSELINRLSSIDTDVTRISENAIRYIRTFDFLWHDDSQLQYQTIIQQDENGEDYVITIDPDGIPSKETREYLQSELERLVQIEERLNFFPHEIQIGCICIETVPIINSLRTFIFSWKSQYAKLLHRFAKTELDQVVEYRQQIQARFNDNVSTLEQLDEALILLEELGEMENKIDSIYLPIETTYSLLTQVYNIPIPRDELQECSQLRDKWSELMLNADRVRKLLLQERRQQLEQELDKQVKSFVVEVIRFRNSFDVEGPNVPDLGPLEASKRLKDFQGQYKIMHKRKQTLNSISTLFSLQPKPFPELDKTGEELVLLDQLYILYKKYIAFDTTFRSTLWSEVDLNQSRYELNQLWTDFCNLPSKLQERIWTAYTDLEIHLKKYLQLLPILFMLNAREIRSRHWLKVMQITGYQFQLESTIFRLNDLLDIPLDNYQNEISAICFSAQKELELETRMRSIEEEWTEQILSFEPYKDYGPVLLEKRYVEHLLEHLEDGEETLAQMLTTRYIEPMREEVASWSEKLKTIGEILELWLEVQDMWLGAENIFNNPSAGKDISLESKRFVRVDKTWLKTQRQSAEIRNVLQCCLSEPPKKGILKEIQKELEICNKSISIYLDRKRQIFPRFYFLTNRTLISLLSRQDTINYVKPHFQALFNGIHELKINVINLDQPKTESGRRSAANGDSRSHLDLNILTQRDIEQVISDDGEYMQLIHSVPIQKSVEQWLSQLQETVADTIRTDIAQCIRDLDNGLPFEELVSKYTCQVSLVGILYVWTREIETGLAESKTDRKGLQTATKRFITLTQKIPTVLSRSQWKTPTQPVLPIHKLRLEGVLAYAGYLRDNIELVCSRRREMTAKDFDWRRCFRVYQQIYPKKSERKSADHSTIETPLPSEPVRMQVMDDIFTYGSEFYGIHQTICLTPTTEKCFLGIWHALSFKRPVIVQGKAGVGKTYTIKSLARFLGRFVATFECSRLVDVPAIAMFITGLATDGCWGIFHNIHTLSANVLSPLAEYITVIFDALRGNSSAATIISENKEISIQSSVGIMATRNPYAINPDNHHRTTLPSEIRSRFRIVSIVKPEIDQIFRVKCFELNLKNPVNIAEKISLLYETVRLYLPIEQRSIMSLTTFLDVLQYVNNIKKRTNSRPNSMTQAGPKIDSKAMKTSSYTGSKSDQLLIAQTFMDVIGARLDPEHAKTFRTFVLDIFVGRDESKMATLNTSSVLEKIICDKAPDHDFIPNKLWVAKLTQMIHAANVSKNMILCGSAHSGKSSAAILMIDILTQIQQQQQLQTFNQQQKNLSQESNYTQETAEQAHKLYRINPLAIESESVLLGYYTIANEWQDGILTTMLRKANRNCHTSWFCFDGIISRTWADLLPSILDKESSIQIRNGDKVFLLDQVKFMFETSSLTDASPSFIANSTVIYFDKSVIDWKVIAGAWLKDRRHLESLRAAFDRVMDPVLTYLREECPRSSYYSEMSLFSITLRILDAILRENSHITTDIHIERFFIFSLTFVLKVILNPDEQKNYSDLLKTLTAVLPDDDREISVFDYYVDESCEWDLWTAKVDELNENIQDRIDAFGNVLVQTVDLARVHYFLKYAALAQVNILLSGTSGSCKSFLFDTFLSGLDPAHFQSARSNITMSTDSMDLQKLIEANVVHRQGFTYGAPLAKKLCLFIDDLQASATNDLGKFKNAPEFLRTLMDHHQFITQQKPYETRIIDDLFVFATATIPPTGEQSLLTLNSRLLRHFAIVNLPTNDSSLRQILTNVIDVNMMAFGKAPISRDMSTKIVDVLMETLQHIQRVLQPSSIPGREHYLFSLRHMIIPIQSLKNIDEEIRNEPTTLAPFLKHELYRIVYDQLAREMDQNWFTDTMNEIFRRVFNWDKPEEDHRYFTFPIEGRSFERPLNSLTIKEIKVQIQPLESVSNLRKIIDQVALRYREEFGHHAFSLSISENTALHIIRMHRILSHPTLSNLFVIGTVGSHLSKLVRLAFYLAEIQEHVIDYSNKSLFYDTLKTVIRITAVEGRHIGILLTNKHLRDTDIIDDISSLLTSCECPHLFSVDEVEGLYQAVLNAYQRDPVLATAVISDPRRFFLTKVRQNLHIAICLPSHSDLLGRLSLEYPGLLKHTQVYWIKNWSSTALYTEASYFLSSHDSVLSEDLHQRLSRCFSDIHYFMLNESRQIPYVGSTDKTIIIRESSLNQTHPLTNRSTLSKDQFGSKKNSTKEVKIVDIELPNHPYSRMLLYEQVKSHGLGKSSTMSQLHAFIGPETFRRFMQSFWYLFTSKAAVCERDIIRLSKVLSTLHKTRQEAENMKDYIQQLKERCSVSENGTAVLLEEVIYKSMVLEKLRAKYALPGCLPGYVYRDDKDDVKLPEEERKLLLEDEADEYEESFKRMKDESLRSRQVKMQEEYEEALKEVEVWRERLADKRKDVEFWMNKVDKSCIERIRTFQTPPVLIGQIMEMVLILIGRKPPVRLDVKEQERERGKLQAERLDRHQWKQYTTVMADISKFIDILHGLNWQDGLNLDISNAVESYIAKGKDGISEGITGEGSLLDNAKNFHVPATRATAAQENRITLGAARYASEEAAVLVHYAIALVEYTRICQPLRLTKERVDKLKQELYEAEQKQIERENEIQRLKLVEQTLQNADSNEEDNRLVDISQYTMDDLPRLENQLAEAQKRFDTAAVEKNKLKKEYESCQLRLQAAITVTESLSDLEDQWTKWIAEHSTHDQTLTNCILAAAYMAYCSPFDADLRRILCEKFLKYCEQYEIPRESDLVFQPIPIDSISKNSFDLSFSMNNQSLETGRNSQTNTIQVMTLAEFLYNPIELKEFELLRLVPTDIMTENGCMIMADAGLHAWPLICDTTWYSIDYIRLFLKNKKLIIVRYHQLRTQLENALSEGHHLLITDCDTNTLITNEKLETVIRNQARFVSSEKPFKLQIGQQEIECSPKFRLYLHTTTQPIFIPKELSAYTLTLNFHITFNDLEEIFLTRFMIKEKPHIDTEQYALLQEKVDTLKIIDPLRQNITNFLASDTVNLLNSVEPTKRLSDLKKAYDEATEGSKRVASQEESLFKTRNSYKKLAQRAATCYNTIHYLQQLLPEYVMPLEHFIDLFDTCIFQSEKHSMGNVMTELTRSAFITILRMLNDRDRRVFALFFAMEIESSNRRQSQPFDLNSPTGEREFIISPAWAAALLQKRGARTPNERFLTYKKPFDWMTDEAFQNLQYLAIYFDWFSEPFDRMVKEVQEVKWRPFCEGDTENCVLPPPLEQLDPIQKFCVVRAVRNDRLLQASTVYIANVFNQDSNKTKSVTQEHQNPPPQAASSSSRTPTIPISPTLQHEVDLLIRQSNQRCVLLLYDDEPDEVINFFLYCTNSIQNDPLIITPTYQILNVYGNGQREERILKKALKNALNNNAWLLLHGLHNSPSFLSHVETCLWELRLKRPSPMPRIWLSLQRTYPLPSSLYNLCLITYIRTPLSMKEAMARAFSLIDNDLLRHSSKVEWIPLLHNVCYIHCALNLRTRYNQAGWDLPSLTSFTNVELTSAFQVLAREFALSDQSTSRLESAHQNTMVTTTTTETNTRQLSWTSMRYTLSELIYGAKALSEYDQRAIINIVDFWIQPASIKKDFEYSKIKYKIPSVFFGQQPKLSQLLQALESISTHQLDVPEACHLHSSYETNLGDDVYVMGRLNRILDALPSTISLTSSVFQRPNTPVEDVTINTSFSSASGLSSSFSAAALYSFVTKKNVGLDEYCTTILASKLPKVLTKDQILDRARRNGSAQNSPFNIWIIREAQLMTDLVTLVRTHVQAIKNACDLSQLGVQWSPELASVAHALYYQRIPDVWCEAIGPSAPPPTWGLNNFFNDLSMRAEHIEKLLTKGREKHPAFNLSAFFNASSLFGIFKQEVAHTLNLSDDTNNSSLMFQCELTPRDREHIREPPKEGLFMYGLYLWGCSSDRNITEQGISDSPTKNRDGCSLLPVMHLTCISTEKAAPVVVQQQSIVDTTGPSRPTTLDTYSCPVFCKRSIERNPTEVICELELWKKTAIIGQTSRWAWRGVCMTVKPY